MVGSVAQLFQLKHPEGLYPHGTSEVQLPVERQNPVAQLFQLKPPASGASEKIEHLVPTLWAPPGGEVIWWSDIVMGQPHPWMGTRSPSDHLHSCGTPEVQLPDMEYQCTVSEGSSWQASWHSSRAVSGVMQNSPGNWSPLQKLRPEPPLSGAPGECVPLLECWCAASLRSPVWSTADHVVLARPLPGNPIWAMVQATKSVWSFATQYPGPAVPWVHHSAWAW